MTMHWPSYLLGLLSPFALGFLLIGAWVAAVKVSDELRRK